MRNYDATPFSFDDTNSNQNSFPSNMIPHTVFQLTARLPQLIHLELSESSALHLSSLSFLSMLPNLESFALKHAPFLPVDSLYDLGHVSSTLTHLQLSKCFSRNSNCGVFLMHDVLTPLQLSFPVTQAVKIKFPEHQTKSGDKYGSLVSSLSNEVPRFLCEPPIDAKSSSSSSMGSSSIPPRYSSWFEIHRHDVKEDERVFELRTRLEVAQQVDPDATEEEIDAHPKYRNVDWTLHTEKQRYAYRAVFDSFTAHAPPVHTGLLTSRLLPHLTWCEIQHEEPNSSKCMVFQFDRLRVPRHRLGPPVVGRSADYHSILKQKREEMRSIYGLQPHPSILEVDGCEYRTFTAIEPLFPPWLHP